jgi:UDP-N-acetyl-D-glucosamine dehydrogenase
MRNSEVMALTSSLGILGMGHAGLPMARAAANQGIRVLGYDVDGFRVQSLRSGRSFVPDVTDTDVAAMLAAGCQFSDSADVLVGADALVISVPTPLDSAGQPDLEHVLAAAKTASRVLAEGMTVIFESTSFPGTTDRLVRWTLEEGGLTAGTDFHLAFSPERIDPGNPTYGIANTPRLVAGLTRECREAAARILESFCGPVIRVSGLREAELAKLIENSYRQVNIALVNEILMLANALGVDGWEAFRAAATKPFGFQSFQPGPGVGGHCIPVDPLYLLDAARSAGASLRLVDEAQRLNDGMPGYLVDRAVGILRKANIERVAADVLLLGVTYKADIADDRGSPAVRVAELLSTAGCVVAYHDPYHPNWAAGDRLLTRTENFLAAAARADLTILVQGHAVYLDGALERCARLILDSRGLLAGPNVRRL